MGELWPCKWRYHVKIGLLWLNGGWCKYRNVLIWIDEYHIHSVTISTLSYNHEKWHKRFNQEYAISHIYHWHFQTATDNDTYHLLSSDIESILPKGPYPPCLRMADRALLAGYHRYCTEKCFVNYLAEASQNYVYTHLTWNNNGMMKTTHLKSGVGIWPDKFPLKHS